MDFRTRLLRRLHAARERTDAIFATLTDDQLWTRPIAERHRLLFYVGHLEAFDSNLLVRDIAGRPTADAALDALFAFGIDPLDGDLPRDTPDDWPSIVQTRAWARAARAAVEDVLETAPLSGWLEGGWAAHVAIEHRLMHAETLSYLVRMLPKPAPADAHTLPTPPPVARPPRRVTVPTGYATMGLDRRTDPWLGWDNEYGRRRVHVDAFDIDVHPVTNREFLAFVEADQYANADVWNPDDRAWLAREGMRMPRTWVELDEGLGLRTADGIRPLPLDWPAWVSHAEASAYARWRGARLPTEAKWHRAALANLDGSERPYPWGSDAPVPGLHGNFSFVSSDPVPVGSAPAGRSVFGVEELVGNGWEWTSTPFAPFDGFEPLPFYRGYSADFFDGRHFVLKGASPVTDASMIRPSFRNFFQPHYPYLFAKFRLVWEPETP